MSDPETLLEHATWLRRLAAEVVGDPALADDVVQDSWVATATSEELLGRHELQQLLARLVGELDEPFRVTILLCYAEGLAPTQIARQFDIPASTVRWRIEEGLERLRCRLDLAHDGDRKAWMLALAPIALRPRKSHAAPTGALAVVAIAAVAVVIAIATRDFS